MVIVGHEAGWRGLWASGRLGRFVLICLGVWLHAADSLVTATIVPAMVSEIGGIAYVGWTIALYQIGAIVAGAATAMLCRRAGQKRVLVSAASVYGAGCILAALAPAMAVLLAARLVQGLGGGALIGLSAVAIQRSFAEHHWSRLFGIVAAIWGAGSLLGPLIGGVFADLGAWRLAFLAFALQAGLLGAMAAAWLEPELAVARESPPTWPWRPLTELCAATLLIAEAGIVRPAGLAAIVGLIGLGLLWATARLDQSAGERVLPAPALDPRHPVGAGLLMVFALSVGTTGFWAYGPLILKIMFGTDPLVSGYILAGEALAWSAATMAVSGAPVSTGCRLIRWGAGLVVLGAAGFAAAVPFGSFAGMVVCAILEGAGFGLCWPSIVHRIVSLSPEDEGGIAASSPGTVQRIGYAVGAAAAGIAANLSGLADGLSPESAGPAGFWVFAGFIPVLSIAGLGAWRFTRVAGDLSLRPSG